MEDRTDGAAKVNPLWGNILRLVSSRGYGNKSTLEVLKHIPIFEDLSRRELVAVARILYLRTYQKDEVIFRQDDPGLGMYIIVQGAVSILGEPAHEPLAELHDGDFFGELALLDELPRSATAVAKIETRTLGFFQPELFGLLERRPRLGVKIVLRLARIIGRRLRAADEQTKQVHRGPGEARCELNPKEGRP